MSAPISNPNDKFIKPIISGGNTPLGIPVNPVGTNPAIGNPLKNNKLLEPKHRIIELDSSIRTNKLDGNNIIQNFY